jgi:diaminohydroxyphosphoribosylaminopyrimidine deaminase/5-amino-6-(5-phosphoribosylamino)uracil reductase
VTVGESADEASELAEAHAKYITTGLPFVTLLLAPTETTARRLEEVTDAVLTDLPLPPRPAPADGSSVRPPLRVVLYAEVGGDARSDVRTVVVTSQRGTHDEDASRRESHILRLPGRDNTIDLRALIEELGRHGITSCLVRGSSTLAEELIGVGVVDKIVAGRQCLFPPNFSPRRDVLDELHDVILYPNTV